MSDRIPLDDLTSDQLDALYDRAEGAEAELTALKTITSGYCPHCGRGDCSPTTDQWYAQRTRADRAEATLERALSPEAIRAAAEAIGDEALTHLGRDIGTIHADHIAEAGLRAALNQAQQPTT